MRADARWYEIAEQLLDDIRAGRIPIGTRIPPIRELAAQHGVAVRTAAKVVSHLRDLGVVETRDGAGTRVIATPADDTPAQALGILYRLADHERELAELRARLDRLERGE